MTTNNDRIGRLPPKEKVAIAIDMTQTCLQLTISGIKAQNPEISEAERLTKLKERLEWAKLNRG
jgi:hypothetical protein